MNSTSPANSSVSTTAIVGGGSGGGVGGVGGGGSSSNNTAPEDLICPYDLFSFRERKDEAIRFLKSDLLYALDKEVKAMDEENWKFEGPRSRIHLISKGGGFRNKQMETTKSRNLASPK